MRILITVCVGIVIGFCIGVSIPSYSPTKNDLVHGWGLDFALQRCVKLPHEQIGVVNDQWIVHQGVPSLGNQGQTMGGDAPWKGVRQRCRDEWTIFRTRMENAERDYFRSIGVDVDHVMVKYQKNLSSPLFSKRPKQIPIQGFLDDSTTRWKLMGLPISPIPADGVLPFILINAALSVALVKKKLQLLLRFLIGGGNHPFHDYDEDYDDDRSSSSGRAERRVSIRRYGNRNHQGAAAAECCLCLSKFESEEEVCELSCRHFFHRNCIERWFDKHHSSCPLCRSIS